jgi:hypothetical protein
LVGCSKGSPEQAVNTFLTLMEQKDFHALETMAPFISSLSEDELLQVSDSLKPYYAEGREIDAKQTSFKTYTVFLSTQNKADKTIIMSLVKDKDSGWLFSENISYQQNFDFIPLDKN